MISACPQCGAPTLGSWSEGGIRWALCDDCLAAPALLAAARERDEQAAELARLRVENERLRDALEALREAIIRDCIPGGSICDPQQVADAVRAWEPPA